MKNISIKTLQDYENSMAAKGYLATQIGNKPVKQQHLDALLHEAVRSNAMQAYNHLLAYFKEFPGLNIKLAQQSLSKDGKTLLHEAVLTQNIELYERLLDIDSGINPFIRDNDRHTAADYAYQQAIKHSNKTTFALLQMAIHNHTAIDVTWLRLPQTVSIENALMMGHIVQENSKKNHLFDIKSVEKAIKSGDFKIEEQGFIANRIAQFKHISPNVELSNVNDVLVNLSYLLPPATIKKENSTKSSDYNEFTVDLSESKDNDFDEIRIEVNKLDSSQLTQAEFIAQIKMLRKQLADSKEFFLTLSARQPTLELTKNSNSLDKIEAIQQTSAWTIGLTFGLALIYNLLLGSVAFIGNGPVYGDCLDYGTNDWGDPVCTKHENLGTLFDDNDWAKMKIAAIIPNSAFAIVIGLAILLRVNIKNAARFTEIISEKLETGRQLCVVDDTDDMLINLLDELIEKCPELGDLIENAEVRPEQASLSSKLQSTPQKIESLNKVLDTQVENLLPQSNDLSSYPALRNLSFLKAPTVNSKTEKTPLLGSSVEDRLLIN